MIEITFLVLVSIVVGCTEVLKRVLDEGVLGKRLAPLIALFFSLLLSMAVYGVKAEGLIAGLIMWLSSMGEWSGGKNIIKG